MIHSSLRWSSVAVLLVGILVASFLVLRIVVAQDATPVSSEGPTAIVDGGCGPIQICRAEHGNVFFGRVVEVVETGKSEDELAIPYVVYIVDIDQSLRRSVREEERDRELSGRVQIKVSGFEMPIRKEGRSAPLVVGKRYLFFAGMRREKGFLVNAEVGFVPVANDAEAAKLIAEFTPLIERAVHEEQAAMARAAVAARSEPETPPGAQIVPDRGPAGSEVVISGSGYTPTNVLILWDANNPMVLPEAPVGPDGRFEITTTVPEGIDPGEHMLTVEGIGADYVELTFVVEE
jgi:hypothetical protein